MLKVNGNTFSACGASFTVPDGYYIEPHGEMEYESGLDIYSPDTKIFFNIEISEQEKPEIEYIKAMILRDYEEYYEKKPRSVPKGMIVPVTVNRLEGFQYIDRFFAESFQSFWATFPLAAKSDPPRYTSLNFYAQFNFTEPKIEILPYFRQIFELLDKSDCRGD